MVSNRQYAPPYESTTLMLAVRVSYDDEQTYTLKKQYADNLCLGGTMVWAIDLDDPTTGQSTDNLNLNPLRLIGDAVDTNPLYGRKKLAATSLQNSVSLLTFWTDCSTNPTCPDGFRPLTTGHGKVSVSIFYHQLYTSFPFS